MATPLRITPQTRVGELLDAHPELEAVFVELAPAFKALRNPILRRTVAQVATIEKAASRGGIEAAQLIHRLKQALGSTTGEQDQPPVPRQNVSETPDPLPEWVGICHIRETINADYLLETGSSPVSASQKAARQLGQGEMICLTSSFRPAPLLEEMTRLGYRVHSQQNDVHSFMTYIAAE